MKQDIIHDQDDCIKPLTYAAIEEEELRVWISEDDDDDDQSLDDYYDDIGSNDVPFSEDDLHTSLESMDLSREEVEEHETLLDGIIQDYIRTWDEQNIFCERLIEYTEAVGREDLFSDMFMEDNEAEDLEYYIFSHTFMENMAAEDLEDIFTDTLMENIEADKEQAKNQDP
ncbi:hypothetical protein KR032_008731 [Drosophila birchii]|nr:hypothetical protein KR032_008731 [Drosophila birchii]